MYKTEDDFIDEVYAEIRARGSEDFEGACEEGIQRWINAVPGEKKLRELARNMVRTCYATMATVGSSRPIPSVDWFVVQLKLAQKLREDEE